MADDEEPARRSVFAMLRELGYACFDEAGDGEDALAYIMDRHPDIVLADIRMPGLTGIEMLERCRALPDPPSFIFISGYDLFEYAQRAIRLGAQGYLLKPFDIDELRSVLDDVCANQWDSLQKLQAGHSPEQQTGVALGKLLQGEALLSDVESELKNICLPPIAHAYAVIELLAHKNLRVSDRSDDRHGKYISAIKRDLQRLFPLAPAITIFSIGAVDAVLLAADELPEAFKRRQAKADWECFRSQLQREFGLVITIVPGKPVARLTEIPESHNSCMQPLFDALFSDELQKGSVLFSTGKAAPYREIYTGRIQEHLVQLDMEGLLQEIQAVYQRFVFHGYQTFSDIGLLHREMLQILDAAMQKLEINSRISGDPDAAFGELLSLASTEDILQWYHSKLLQFMDELQNPASASNIPVSILRAKQFMQKNLASSLSLETVSRHVGLSPNYLSSCFKRETKVTFGAYLLRIRIQEAQKLLRTGQYKAAEVSTRVGFSDNKYFYKVFKKITGVTPGKYR